MDSRTNENLIRMLRDELEQDPKKLGYLPQSEMGRDKHDESVEQPLTCRKIPGNDIKNAELLNAKKDGGKSRAEELWGDDWPGIVITAQQVADSHWR